MKKSFLLVHLAFLWIAPLEALYACDDVNDNRLICKSFEANHSDFENLRNELFLLKGRLTTIDQRLSFLDSVVPVGTIIEYSGLKSPPDNWLECDGREIRREVYPELLLVIGVTYGMGDGLNTFRLPDRRGRNAVGIDSNNSTNGLVTNSTAPRLNLGGVFGSETHKLTVSEMPRHSHLVNGSKGSANPGCNTSLDSQKTNSPYRVQKLTESSGFDEPHNNMSPGIFMRFYIRAK